MSKNINDLRDGLFEAMQMLKEGKLTVEQAKAISEMGQVVINSAKVEVEYIKANNGGETPFLKSIGNDSLPSGVVSVTRHRLAG